MAEDSFTRYLLLPELRLLETRAYGKDGLGGTELLAEKVSEMEVCPHCATPSTSVYDRRWVRLKDEPLRLRQTILSVHKRRFAVETADDVSTLRARMIEQASRDGEERTRQQRAIQEIERRLRELGADAE